MSDDNDLDAARAELAALESEAEDLKKQIDDLEAQLQKLRQRYGKIIPTGWVGDRSGLITRAKEKVARLELLAADSLLPKVRGRYSNGMSAWNPYVITSNGPKRGMLRTPGTNQTTQIPSTFFEVHPDDAHLLHCLKAKAEG